MRNRLTVALFVFVLAGCGRPGTVERAVGPNELPEGTVGQPYSVKFSLLGSVFIGGDPRYLILSGDIPPGINGDHAVSEEQRLKNFTPGCQTENGQTLCSATIPVVTNGLDGTPTLAGTYTFTVEGYTPSEHGAKTYTMVVKP